MSISQKLQLSQPAHYVLAVSGGVDSMALLHLVANLPVPWKFTVAHVDHGMRPDSKLDQAFVRQKASEYGMEFESISLNLRGASEAVARRARYNFLRAVCLRIGASGLMTAHHADDRIETAWLNADRGAGRRGLVALRSTNSLSRPLIGITKAELLEYAREQGLDWREDSTNVDTTIARNAVRHQLLPQLSMSQRQQIMMRLDELEKLQDQIDAQLAKLVNYRQGALAISRTKAKALSYQVCQELIVFAARQLDPAAEVSSRGVSRLALALKTGTNGQSWQLNRNLCLSLTPTEAVVSNNALPIKFCDNQALGVLK